MSSNGIERVEQRRAQVSHRVAEQHEALSALLGANARAYAEEMGFLERGGADYGGQEGWERVMQRCGRRT